MVYRDKYVVSVLVNGQILPERKDGSVILQYGTEYSLRLRNKNDHRCVCKIYIDDENVSGGGYVIDAQSYIEIERFNNVNRKFKLVEPNSPEAADFAKGPRDDGANGVVRCEFYAEKKVKVVKEYVPYVVPYTPIVPVYPTYPPYKYYLCHNDINSSLQARGDIKAETQETAQTFGFTANNCYEREVKTCGGINLPKEGVTVEGGESSQRFYKTTIDLESTCVTLIVKLLGQESKVETKAQYCTKCGTKVTPKQNFCSICGRKL